MTTEALKRMKTAEAEKITHLEFFNIGVSAGIETTAYPVDFIEGSNRMNLNLVSSNHSKNVALNCNYEKTKLVLIIVFLRVFGALYLKEIFYLSIFQEILFSSA